MSTLPELPSPTWHRGMYGCPQDMFTAEQMRQHAEAVRESLAGQYDELAAEAHHDLRNPKFRHRAESIAGRAVAYETAATTARGVSA